MKGGDLSMKLSFKFRPRFNQKQLKITEELSWHTTKLYNVVNYECRENGFRSYYKLEKEYRHNWHRAFLHSHTYQHCLKMLDQNWLSYFKSIKDYEKNPGKYKGKPGLPRFKNTETKKNEVIFTNFAVRMKEGILRLSLSKEMQQKHEVKFLNFEVSKKLQSLIDFETIQQVRIKWDNVLKEWYLIIIYKKEVKEAALGNNVMSIDLGLNNLATITFKDNIESYIINGKTIKSVNSYLNKEIARLASVRMKQRSERFTDTKKITKLRRYRRNYIKDYLHKASRKIVKLANQYRVGTIVIGDMKDIKQGMDYNKSFVQIPVQRLAEMIEYKAELEGIKVVKVTEEYTSGVSAFDLEEISKKNYKKARRIKRGYFRATIGYVNADQNGSLNILRKYLKDKCIPEPIIRARDKGVVDTPRRIRVA